jgi:hypothetical protein
MPRTVSARDVHLQGVSYIHADIVFGQANSTVTVGVVPAYATIDNAYVIVSTAFNAATTNTIDIGTSADPDGFATALALGTIGKIAADEMATSNDLGPFTADTTIVCVPTTTGTAASAGVARVVVTFIVNH